MHQALSIPFVAFVFWAQQSFLLDVAAFSTPASVTRDFRHHNSQTSHRRIVLYSDLKDPSVSQVDDGAPEQNDKAATRRHGRKRRTMLKLYRLPRVAYQIYTSYAKRLWKETDVSARKKIANDKFRVAVRSMQQLLSDEYLEFSDEANQTQKELLQACDRMLASIPLEVKSGNKSPLPPKTKQVGKKKSRSVLFGALMGAAVACWVFSGNYVFTGVFTLMTILGQLEYYRMIINTGVYPARRISVIGAASMFLTVRHTILYCWVLFNIPTDVPYRLCLHQISTKFVSPCLVCGP